MIDEKIIFIKELSLTVFLFLNGFSINFHDKTESPNKIIKNIERLFIFFSTKKKGIKGICFKLKQ